MQYIVAVEERRPDCWMVLPPRRGGARTVAGAWRALPAAAALGRPEADWWPGAWGSRGGEGWAPEAEAGE